MTPTDTLKRIRDLIATAWGMDYGFTDTLEFVLSNVNRSAIGLTINSVKDTVELRNYVQVQLLNIDSEYCLHALLSGYIPNERIKENTG